MKRNYLSLNEDDVLREYSKKESYISSEQSTTIEQDYILLPEEYDIFSEIDPRLFTQFDTQQHILLSSCLIYIKERLVSIFLANGVMFVLPKMQSAYEQGSIVLNLAYSGYRVFFSFDSDEMGATAYCGIVVQDEEASISTQTKKIDLKNYKKAINDILQPIIENS